MLSKIQQEAKEVLTNYIEKNQLRKTPERFSILEMIYDTEGHFDAEQLYINIKNKSINVSRATVYNTLDVLVACELVTKHQFGSNHAVYEKAYGSRQHDHLICMECGEVFEFCDPRLHQIKQTAAELFDQKVRNHALTLYGNCQKEKCSNKKK
ncbi:MAG: transcriptional repressor [Bacteroidetes bacterium]|jgi:Fur family transcriptional regulator, ferric uptake regulator|nr:transcriptional repressor [Bacteroidota bacterium]